jgi:MFS family permease
VFGVLTDRFGRARIMLVTIVIYAVFTGLSALAQNWVQLAICQAIAGLGIGGEWSAGAALLAESLPERLRAPSDDRDAAGVLRRLLLRRGGEPRWSGGRLALGALLVRDPRRPRVVLRLFVKEPERWVRTHEKVEKVGRLRRLFEPDLRRRTWGGSSAR